MLRIHPSRGPSNRCGGRRRVSWARKPRIESLEQRRLLSTIRTIVYNQLTLLPATDPLARNERFNTLSAEGTFLCPVCERFGA